MVKHIVKIMWNSRRKWVGIFVEQCLIFIVLMLLIVQSVNSLFQYNEPGMLDTENMVVFVMSPVVNDIPQNEADDINRQQNAMIKNMRQNLNVLWISESVQLIPYLRSDNNYVSDSITIGDIKIRTFLKGADQAAFKLGPKLIEGEWITSNKLKDGSVPVVITKEFAEQAGWSNPVGIKIDKISYLPNSFTVVGMIDGLKHEVWTPSVSALIMPIDILGSNLYREFALKVKPGSEEVVYSQLYHQYKRDVTDQRIMPVFAQMSEMKRIWITKKTIGLGLQAVPTIFLLIFAFIGAFGLFWLNSQRRIGEFGLRVAIGSIKRRLTGMIVMESLIVTLTASLPGIIISLFIYDFTIRNFIGVTATLIIMIIFAIMSAWYSAYGVSKINPATALKNE